jgi:hypothetical protein
MADQLYPPTIMYGTAKPEIRFRWKGGTMQFFCLNNNNLHLCDECEMSSGTYEMGMFLGRLCEEYCVPKRDHRMRPCPAFVADYKIGTENKGLATVEMHPTPKLELCGGIQKLLEMEFTAEERFFFTSYVENKYSDESKWRDQLVNDWNEAWHVVPDGWGVASRRGLLDQMIWWTLRFPALIPQVWLNWLYASSEEDIKRLDANPSRVDFVAFWRSDRYVIEIDGPSHYAAYCEVTHEYTIDERMYARNLKIERTLKSERWNVIRIGRSEVREAMNDPLGGFLGSIDVLKVLPFYPNAGYDDTYTMRDLGLPQIQDRIEMLAAREAAEADIPF